MQRRTRPLATPANASRARQAEEIGQGRAIGIDPWPTQRSSLQPRVAHADGDVDLTSPDSSPRSLRFRS